MLLLPRIGLCIEIRFTPRFAAIIDDLLQVIEDGIVAKGLALAQQMFERHSHRNAGVAIAFRLGLDEKFIDEVDGVFTCAILFETLTNDDQVFVNVHAALTFPKESRYMHKMCMGGSRLSLTL